MFKKLLYNYWTKFKDFDYEKFKLLCNGIMENENENNEFGFGILDVNEHIQEYPQKWDSICTLNFDSLSEVKQRSRIKELQKATELFRYQLISQSEAGIKNLEKQYKSWS